MAHNLAAGHLQLRAQLLSQIRQFFAQRRVMEVETPLARGYTVTEPHQQSFQLAGPLGDALVAPLFLQTSPEYAMKQLLAHGSGDIYQICKAFRFGEQGSRHSPEFTMLEWYRLGFDHQALMDEVAQLLQLVVGQRPVQKLAWRAAFIQYAGIDPVTATLEQLIDRVLSWPLQQPPIDEDQQRRLAIDLLLIERVEPVLGRDCFTFLYDYPADQAALARVENRAWPVAQRFELYVEGVELANGFHELADQAEQRRRFEEDNHQRRLNGVAAVELDESLLMVLDDLPDCSGVALGVDRLLQLISGAGCLAEVKV